MRLIECEILVTEKKNDDLGIEVPGDRNKITIDLDKVEVFYEAQTRKIDGDDTAVNVWMACGEDFLILIGYDKLKDLMNEKP